MLTDPDWILTNQSEEAKHLRGEAVTKAARQAFRLTAVMNMFAMISWLFLRDTMEQTGFSPKEPNPTTLLSSCATPLLVMESYSSLN